MCLTWWHVLHLHAIANTRVIYATITNVVELEFHSLITVINDYISTINNNKLLILMSAIQSIFNQYVVNKKLIFDIYRR